uniref:Uncharacterized protein n=1 Tax=Cacopsylla melanoneura TaxID=428564 RepID=A0A8D8QK22_9HEMI
MFFSFSLIAAFVLFSSSLKFNVGFFFRQKVVIENEPTLKRQIQSVIREILFQTKADFSTLFLQRGLHYSFPTFSAFFLFPRKCFTLIVVAFHILLAPSVPHN